MKSFEYQHGIVPNKQIEKAKRKKSKLSLLLEFKVCYLDVAVDFLVDPLFLVEEAFDILLLADDFDLLDAAVPLVVAETEDFFDL